MTTKSTPAFYVTETDTAETVRRWLTRGPRYRSVEAIIEPPRDVEKPAKLVLLLRGRPPGRLVKKRIIYPLPDDREMREQIAPPYREGWSLGPVALLRVATAERSEP